MKDTNALPDAPEQVDAFVATKQIQIMPAQPRTLDDLTASVVGESEPAGSRWRWSVNDQVRTTVTTATVANAETVRDEVWKAELVDSGNVVLGVAEVTIQNTPPTPPVVGYSPATPTASLPFQCVVTAPSTDDDGDAITYSATWVANGAAFASTSSTVFPADTIAGTFTKVNDVFQCNVTASDGAASSTVADAGAAAAAACRVYSTSTTLNATAASGKTGTIQTFTVPAGVCSVRIEVAGAKGGTVTGTATNNNGARMIGTFAVTEGSALKVLVGQQGVNYAGGGGTFVTTNANAPLIIAGGGGTNGCPSANCSITNAELMGRIVTSGGAPIGVTAANNGAGGNIVGGAFTGGGGGFNTNGAGASGGFAFVNGGTGGEVPAESGTGGFGGGGGRGGLYGEGGGGGYSGGSCANTASTWVGCGGGGSLNNGTAPTNVAGINAAAGYAKFTY